jgi:hypothetical protein
VARLRRPPRLRIAGAWIVLHLEGRPVSLQPTAAAPHRQDEALATAAENLPTELVVHADADQAFCESDRAV